MATIGITDEDLKRLKEADQVCERESMGPDLDSLIAKMEAALEQEKAQCSDRDH